MNNLSQFTPNENAVIQAIINSNYFDGSYPTDPVWMIDPTDCGFDNNRTLSGTISSLVQKGYINTDGKGKDAMIAFTDKFIQEFWSK